ncbi:MAG: 1-deoxy-D-xylulose-5-phosphate synthase, partial [Clostridia bacterium]|nr:1-deoxy-D-xylulose-5-phosphate synthase [Clostridia bacterium]
IAKAKKIYIFEEGMKSGGFCEALATSLCEKGYSGKINITAIEKFVAHSTVGQALKILSLDSESIIKKVKGEA